MNIFIKQKLCPFSHAPGTKSLIPRTSWEAQLFPTLFRFKNTTQKFSAEIYLTLRGPAKDFTITQDLDRGELEVFGTYQEGYCHFRIWAFKKQLHVSMERGCEDGILIKSSFKEEERLFPKQTLSLPFSVDTLESLPAERLFLGENKKLDWDLIRRRKSLTEILPIWFRLGQCLVSPPENVLLTGTARLLELCAERISNHQRLEIERAFLDLFLSGFSSLLSPRLFDEEYQGICPDGEVSSAISPMVLLIKGSQLIRSLFFSEGPSSVEILPCLPPSFHKGRFLFLRSDWGSFDLEWTKKSIRRIVLRSEKDGNLSLKFPFDVQSFRLRAGHKDAGMACHAHDNLSIRKGILYWFDRFQK